MPSPTRSASTFAGSATTAIPSCWWARRASARTSSAELDRALSDHELVKVRARVGDRDLRDQILDELAAQTGAELVQRIGHVALFYRPNPEKPGILLPA